MVDMDESFFGVLGLGLRRGKVDGDGIELACGKQLRQRCGASGQDECVGQLLLADFLRGIGDADGLLVHADKEGVGLTESSLNQIGAFAAAQIQMKAGEGRAASRRAGFAPISGIGLGVRLNRIGVALQALLEHKVLGRANVDGSHEAPWSYVWNAWLRVPSVGWKTDGHSLPKRCGAARRGVVDAYRRLRIT